MNNSFFKKKEMELYLKYKKYALNTCFNKNDIKYERDMLIYDVHLFYIISLAAFKWFYFKVSH